MPATATSYPAKILLFGEHTVLRGGLGLAVPYPRFSLRWARDTPDERLLSFCDYLKVAIHPTLLRTAKLEDDLLEDLRLVGDIPEGYGLGSSGAVCAAIWDRYATDAGKSLNGEALRNQLARMEQHFHGSSSGTDPLISYTNQPMLLGNGRSPREVRLPNDWHRGFYLLDTGITRSAAPLIRQFTEAYDGDAEFGRRTQGQWSSQADACIQALLAGKRTELRSAFQTISRFQREELPESFIPQPWRDRWYEEPGHLKICGAGGGGMLLGFSPEESYIYPKLF